LADYAKQQHAGRNLARCMLSEASGIPYQDLVIAEETNGKPYFAAMPEVHFNSSHSGKLVASIIAPHPVGIDCEHHRENRDFQALANSVCTIAEQESLRSLHHDGAPWNSQAIMAFYRIWTAREAWLKFHDLRVWDLAMAPCMAGLLQIPLSQYSFWKSTPLAGLHGDSGISLSKNLVFRGQSYTLAIFSLVPIDIQLLEV